MPYYVALPKPLADRLARPNVPGLNAVRAGAVMLVILSHGGFGLQYVPGGYGVTIFFVLSGFLITWLLLKEHAKTGTISLRGFYLRRTLRIVPAFWVYWVFVVAYVALRHKPVPWAHAFSALFYMSNYYNALNGDPNTGFSHTWSLSTEEQFYLLWPAIFLLFVLPRGRKAVSILLAMVATAWVYRAVLVFGLHVSGSYLYAAFEMRCDAILVGCALAFVLYQQRWGPLWRVLTAHPLVLLVTVLAMGVVSTVHWWTGVAWTRDVILGALGPLLAAVLIVQVVALSGTPLWCWLESPVVRYLGLISYSLYLWQQVTLHAATSRLESAPYWMQALGSIGLTVVFASGSYFLVEKPFLRLKDRFGHSVRHGTGQARVADEALSRPATAPT